MPIYEYHCNKCEKDFEELVLGSNPVVKCPACQSSEVAKKMSACAFKAGSQFVGTGKKASVGGCGSCSSTNCSSCGG